MITAIVEFPLGEGIPQAKAAELFEGSAPRYREAAGLVRKYYLFDPETGTGGGVYLWESRAAADAMYTEEWKAMIAERYGTRPQIRFFETPVIVDNAKGAVEVAA
jgi:hypothetical protein